MQVFYKSISKAPELDLTKEQSARTETQVC